MAIELVPLETFGAEILGLDLDRPIEADTRAWLYQAWIEHGVLLFRNTGVNERSHLELSRCFGALEEHAIKSLLVGDSKELIEVERGGIPRGPSYFIRDRLTTGFLFWHQDLVYTPNICTGGMLRMIKAPDQGGETGWIDTARAYDALPETMRSRIAGLEVRHCLRLNPDTVPFGLDPTMRKASVEEAPYQMSDIPDMPHVVHPLVSTHPETGRKSLGISPLTLVEILGMERAESDALLAELVEHTLRPEFMFVHDWAVDDLVLWDNRRTIHCAFGHPYDQERVAHRTTLAGGIHSGRLYEEVG